MKRLALFAGSVGIIAIITIAGMMGMGVMPQRWIAVEQGIPEITESTETTPQLVAILPPLDESLIPFPDEDEAAFDATQDPDGGPRQAFEWFWRQRAYPLNTVPFDANNRAFRQARAQLAQVQAASVNMPVWESMGPAPLLDAHMGTNVDGDVVRQTAAGRVTALAIPPSDSDTIYVATSTGGLWKSTDGGDSFVPLTNDRVEYAFQSLVIDPQNEDTIYAGTGQFTTFYGTGLLKSTDAGATWTALGKETFGALMLTGVFVHPNDSDTLVVTTATLGKLETAKKLPGEQPAPGIYRSSDGGQTWTMVQSCEPCARGFTAMVMDASDPQQPAFYAASSGVGLYKSTDAGVSWQKLDSFDSAVGRVAYKRVALAIGSGTGANIVYAGLDGESRTGKGGIVMRTTDGGQTWTEVTAARGYCDTQCDHDNAIGINPQNPDIVYFGGVQMFSTEDGGETVARADLVDEGQSDAGLHVDHQVIVFDPNDPSIVWVGNDGGLYRFANGQWETRNNGMATLQFIGIGVNPVDGSQALGGMQDNSQAYWDGTSWQGFDSADGNKGEWDPFQTNIVYYGDQQISFKVSEEVNIDAFRGDVPGDVPEVRLNGVDDNDDAEFYIPFELDPVQDGVLYLGTDKIYRSTDRANNWTDISGIISAGEAVKAIGIARSNPNRLYVGMNFGSIHVGQRQGNQWTFRDVSDEETLPERVLTDIAVHPTNADIVYIVFNGFSQNTPNTPGHVFKSTDAGQNWTRLDGTGNDMLPDIPVLSIVLDPDNAGHIYIGTDIGVFHSSDDGQTWVLASQGLPPSPVFDLKYVQPMKQLWAATYGRSIWRTTLDGSDSVSTPTAAPTEIPTETPVPTDTPVPTSTPTAPAEGIRPGEWRSEETSLDFNVASDQETIYDIRIVTFSENNCRQVLVAPGPIEIDEEGSFDYIDERDRDEYWSVTGTLEGETASGNAVLENIRFGTSTCGDGLNEELEWDAEWVESSPDPTPTPTRRPFTAPPATSGIIGQVRANGEGVADINLRIIRCSAEEGCDFDTDTLDDRLVAETRTDTGGFYRFADVPSLPDGQSYQLYYFNDELGGNIANDRYLYRWFGAEMSAYTAGESVDGGVIDISELVLLEPNDGNVTYPETFTWRARPGLTENYNWVLADDETGDEACTGPTSDATSFTLTEEFATTNCPALTEGRNYIWYVWAVEGEDADVDPAGDSFFAGEVVLGASAITAPADSQNVYLPFVSR